ncbi:MAG: redoxin domain-containing protein, partial [Verrucomicrobiota bacterium]
MKTLPILFLFIALHGSLFAAPPPPDGVKTLAIGSPAPEFSLPGTDGKQHTLEQYAQKKVLAVLFTCNHCPTAQAVEARVKQLVEDLADQSFQLLAISPNDPLSVRVDELGYSIYGDSFEDMASHAKTYEFNFPYLYDGETQKTSMAFGAMATPHIFVFDKNRKLRYQGRLDDSKYEDGATSHDARVAIDALLADEKVPVETTRIFGCSTKWAYKRDLVSKHETSWKEREVIVEQTNAEGVRHLVSNKSEKLRMINLWATWCGPCVSEFPDLVSLGRQF